MPETYRAIYNNKLLHQVGISRQHLLSYELLVTKEKIMATNPKLYIHYFNCHCYRGADKSLARPGRKKATATRRF